MVGKAFLVAVMILGTVSAGAAETGDWGPNVLDNRNRIASAMAALLIPEEAGALASFTDVDLDGFWDLSVSKGCAACRARLLRLEEDSYRDLLEDLPAAEAGVQPQALDQTRRGYRDLRLGEATLTWNGSQYAIAAPASVLDAERFLKTCTERKAYDVYGEAHEAAEVNRVMCSCVANRVMEMGFSQAELDGFLDWPHDESDAASGSIAQEKSLIDATCSIRNGFQDQLPVAPQMYATWTENYGELVGNPYFSGDPSQAENALIYDRFMQSCHGNPDLVRSAQVRTGDRALAVCGCIAERLTMAGAEQLHVDAMTSLYDFSKSDKEVEELAPGLIAFDDDQGSWCIRRLSALVDKNWPEAAD